MSIRKVGTINEKRLIFYLIYRHNMTNGLLIFLVLYALVGQPAIIWWMLDNTQLYELAWLNAWIFLIALIISAICKPNKSKNPDNEVKLLQKSEEKVSRIENDNGVAVVEVERKEELVVETNNDGENDEWESESNNNVEEKLEEKVEESKKEKVMKEPVSIPKIVQPLTWYTPTKRRKRERKWGQWLILLLTLWIAAVIAWTLWEFLSNWGVAIALFLWWILYLVIWKLFDVNWFYNAKKLFTNWLYIVLILAGIWYWIYAMQQEDKEFKLLPDWFCDKVVEYVKDLFNKNEEDVPQVDTWAIYVFEWTWEIINSWDNLSDTEDLNSEWQVENEDESNVEDIVEDNNVEDEQNALTAEEAKKQVTMWEAIKSILAWMTLSTKTTSTFKYVSKSNELYPYFKTAQEKWMIWTDADPSKYVSCETYITMKWLAEWWNVWSYAKGSIKSVYWDKAEELWKLNWCEKWSYVTKGNL